MSVTGSDLLAGDLHALVGGLDAAAERLLQSEFGVTHSQLAFLMPLLQTTELDVSTLAAATGVSVPAVSKRVTWFTARGLVRARHPHDSAKRVVLSLTPKGRRLATAASTRLGQRLDELLAAWPIERRDLFHELVLEVTDLVARIDGVDDEESA